MEIKGEATNKTKGTSDKRNMNEEWKMENGKGAGNISGKEKWKNWERS